MQALSWRQSTSSILKRTIIESGKLDTVRAARVLRKYRLISRVTSNGVKPLASLALTNAAAISALSTL